MPPLASSGDVALEARPATAETFAPFGRLLVPGERSYLGKKGRLLLALDEKRAGPRRVTDLYRYPEAKRVILPMSAVPMWLVAVEGGEQPRGQPVALILPSGCGLMINEGVWHAGPTPLEDAAVCEMLETVGAADRFDRRSLRELLDVEGVRIVLPDESAGLPERLDVTAKGAVRLDASLAGRVKLGCITLEGLELDAGAPTAASALKDVVARLRAEAAEVDLGEIADVAEARRVYEALGLDPERTPPRAETLLRAARADTPLPTSAPADVVLALCALRRPLPMSAFDLDTIGSDVCLRVGAAGEGYEGTDRRRLDMEGQPVLCDAQGPFGSPLGDARRARLGPGTRRMLAVMYLPATMDTEDVEMRLRAVAATIGEHCGGRTGALLILG